MKVEDICQLVQDDLICYFDGMPDRVINEMCELIEGRFKEFSENKER